MPNWNRIVRERLATRRLPPEREIEIVEEIALHLEAIYEDARLEGLSESAAQARATQSYDWSCLENELGRVERPRGGIKMESWLQDVRYGARTLGRRPAFTLIVVLTLAIGIGANTAIFSTFNGLVLKPLPYPEPDRLVNLRISTHRGQRYQPGVEGDFSLAGSGHFHDWRVRSRSFERLTASRLNSTIFTDGEQTQYVQTMRVTDGFFTTYGISAQIGRTFNAQDYGAAAPPVIILNYDQWQSRYAGDPKVIGRTITLDGEPRTIVGVMPSSFWPMYSGAPPRVWVPYALTAEEETNRNSGGRWDVVARLRPGVSMAQAQDEMDSLAAQLEAEYPDDYKNRGGVLVPVDSSFIDSLGGLHRILLLLLGAVALVLLLACVNVANLLLVRAAEREREFAIRAALGAGRARLVRQLVTESLLLAVMGGALGVLVGIAGMRALSGQLGGVPRMQDLRFDWQALAFTAGLTLVTGLFFGLVPAWRAARPELQQMLNESGRSHAASRSRRRVGSWLVTGEVTLAMLLLVGAGLIVRSFIRLQRTDPGFAADHLLTVKINVPDYKYGRFGGSSQPGDPDVKSRIQLYRRIDERLNALPGVEAAALTNRLPVQDAPEPRAFNIAGRQQEIDESLTDDPEDCRELRRKAGLPCHGTLGWNPVTPDYFRTLGLRLLRGRLFDQRDREGTPLVAVISETAARRYWPDADPIGQRLTLNHSSWFPQYEIVGVVSDIKTDDLNKPPYPEFYRSSSQFPSDDAHLVIRTRAAPETLAPLVREELARLDRDMPVRNVRTMENVIAGSLGRARLAAWLLGCFAALAAVLAAAGLYGVMSYTINQRTNEIGLRMALGATAGDVRRMVLGEGSRLVIFGVAAGSIAALTLSRLLANFIFGVTATDPLTYAGVALLLALVALPACYLPARKATRVDPLTALRHE
ncbi:MAG TPA: ABC transporter permease [Blastocatellia bacterium]|nr:ABC transporter permease [Blastocatellia bacterium]